MGLLNAILIFKTINYYVKKINHTNNYQTSALFNCDNKAVTITTNKHQYAGTSTKDYYKADFDIIAKIDMIWTTLIKDCVQLKVIHILGHQDRNAFPPTAELNVLTEKLATKAVNQKKACGILPAFTEITLYVYDLTTTADFKKNMTELSIYGYEGIFGENKKMEIK
jgi:hypothetical protein